MNYSSVKENIKKCKQIQQDQTSKFGLGINYSISFMQILEIRKSEINFKRLDERIDSQAEKFLKKLKDTDVQFRQMKYQINQPIKENQSINLNQSNQEIIKIHKSMLQKLETGQIQPQQLLPKRQPKAQSIVDISQTREDQTVDIIRKMKREKARKIWTAYRRYKFRLQIKKTIAVKKIQKWYRRQKLSSEAIMIQKHIRGFLARKRVIKLKEEDIQYKQAVDIFRRNTLWKVYSALYGNIEEQQNKRKNSRFYPMMKKYGSIQKIHLGLMEGIDFWEIFPKEGKYAMAVEFHKKRMLAIIFARWLLTTDDIL
ncbi:UNKNOWN [Stylonychia lemnae]|uniref:Iq calmodulin-binding motif family protein n=1 Tax=Stylonychia lemnae TaxID=5949 RepID=A0A078BB68_STYLE|nr:UNKNOWN [Stylonychia lemnae]|eukprot:CDW91805.1 UNKNOWN [Stylonychia lemnae]